MNRSEPAANPCELDPRTCISVANFSRILANLLANFSRILANPRESSRILANPREFAYWSRILANPRELSRILANSIREFAYPSRTLANPLRILANLFANPRESAANPPQILANPLHICEWAQLRHPSHPWQCSMQAPSAVWAPYEANLDPNP